ncbi:hypothetical protein HDU76_001528 [Blyttiomyces sp. JEL0837]|nr:hypothetical protein HDU76_001528 [Blyttiomyces sp. JEL0837]
MSGGEVIAVDLTGGDPSRNKAMDLDAFKKLCALKLNLIPSTIKIYDANRTNLILSEAHFQSSVNQVKEHGTAAMFLFDGVLAGQSDAVASVSSPTGDLTMDQSPVEVSVPTVLRKVPNLQGVSWPTTLESKMTVSVSVIHIVSKRRVRLRVDYPNMTFHEFKNKVSTKMDFDPGYVSIFYTHSEFRVDVTDDESLQEALDETHSFVIESSQEICSNAIHGSATESILPVPNDCYIVKVTYENTEYGMELQLPSFNEFNNERYKQFAISENDLASMHIVHGTIVVTSPSYFESTVKSCKARNEDAAFLLQPKVRLFARPPMISLSHIAPSLPFTADLKAKDSFDVMISYDWSQGKNLALKLKENFNDQLFRVWFDEEEMDGDIYDRMAEGVAKSMVITPIMTIAYSSKLDPLVQWLQPVVFRSNLEKFKNEYVQNTRMWAIKEVHQWLTEKTTPLLWLNGGAGLGKSIIAFLISANLPTGFNLGSVFFCKYDDNATNNAIRIVSTIAFDIASNIPEYRDFLIATMETDAKAIENGEISVLDMPSTAFEHLIINGLRKIRQPETNIVIVIDALDEIGKQGELRRDFLNLIRERVKDLPKWVRFFVTSRPQMDIFEALNGINCSVLLPQDEDNLDDIHEFVRHHLTMGLSVDQKNDTETKKLNQLVKNIAIEAGGVFQYGRLVCNLLTN